MFKFPFPLGLISLSEQPWEQTYTQPGIFGLVYLGVFAAAIANTLFSSGIQKIGPTQTAIFVNMVPVVGVLSSVLLAACPVLDELYLPNNGLVMQLLPRAYPRRTGIAGWLN